MMEFHANFGLHEEDSQTFPDFSAYAHSKSRRYYCHHLGYRLSIVSHHEPIVNINQNQSFDILFRTNQKRRFRPWYLNGFLSERILINCYISRLLVSVHDESHEVNILSPLSPRQKTPVAQRHKSSPSILHLRTQS